VQAALRAVEAKDLPALLELLDDAAVFVEVGASVRKGQVVCIVEAMKLMNEIESEADGKVAEFLVKNGEHVEYGQKLIRLA